MGLRAALLAQQDIILQTKGWRHQTFALSVLLAPPPVSLPQPLARAVPLAFILNIYVLKYAQLAQKTRFWPQQVRHPRRHALLVPQGNLHPKGQVAAV